MAYFARRARLGVSGLSCVLSTLCSLVIAACSGGEPTSVSNPNPPETQDPQESDQGITPAITTLSTGHEPYGYTKVFNSVFSSPLSYTKNSEGWYIQWGVSRYLSNTTLLLTSTAPVSPTSVVSVRYPTSTSGGTSPSRFFYGGTYPSNHGYLYQRVVLKIDAHWTDNGNSGTKWGFFKTHGYINNNGWGVTYYSGHKIRVFSQFNDQPGNNREWVATTSLTKGVWHTVELLIEPGTAGYFNGTLRGWVDGNAITWTRKGVYATTVTNMMWFEKGQTPHYDYIYWDGTYGGGTNSPPYTMYMWCDNWYASVK
jgi:hypothetical protein